MLQTKVSLPLLWRYKCPLLYKSYIAPKAGQAFNAIIAAESRVRYYNALLSFPIHREARSIERGRFLPIAERRGSLESLEYAEDVGPQALPKLEGPDCAILNGAQELGIPRVSL